MLTPARPTIYSPMRHLASAVFLSRRGAGGHMALFHSYGDTSGTQSSRDGKTLVTVGVVATDKKWERFDKRWTLAMREFGVTELHMKDFAHSVGQYKNWKGD